VAATTRINRRKAGESEAILSEVVKSVTIYTTDHCSLCLRAKTLLSRRGISYEEINLARDPDSRDALSRRTGMFTFPQIVINGEPVGGFTELLAADRDGRLVELLAA
jgi:glutaredoxin 3